MTLKDQVDFLICDPRIHGWPAAWKLGASIDELRSAVRAFSIQLCTRLQQPANVDAAPADVAFAHIPIHFNRSVFGDGSETNGPDERG